MSRPAAFVLLALASLMWSGNWVAGRALRDAYDPVTLNFCRWAIAAAVLAPFALRELEGMGLLIRRNLGYLAILSFTGAALFQCLVYLGLQSTTAINGVLLNSASPLFMILCSWAIEGERTTRRQVAGMLISFTGILVILSRGELRNLLQLQLHEGDAWILLAMPVWGVYSVLLKRRPPGLGGVALLFMISVLAVLMLAPLFALELRAAPPEWPTPAQAAGILYVGVAASAAAFICWNKGVAIVGANAAGFTLHLLPAFGTILAIVFLDESFGAHHAGGIATIVAGVILATKK
jgi:drug/metabolite transporter (DMT)-like permease